MPLGWGPRHMAIFNDVAYVIFELKNRVGVYRINPSNGDLIEAQSIPTIEDNNIKGISTHCALLYKRLHPIWFYTRIVVKVALLSDSFLNLWDFPVVAFLSPITSFLFFLNSQNFTSLS